MRGEPKLRELLCELGLPKLVCISAACMAFECADETGELLSKLRLYAYPVNVLHDLLNDAGAGGGEGALCPRPRSFPLPYSTDQLISGTEQGAALSLQHSRPLKGMPCILQFQSPHVLAS